MQTKSQMYTEITENPKIKMQCPYRFKHELLREEQLVIQGTRAATTHAILASPIQYIGSHIAIVDVFTL